MFKNFSKTITMTLAILLTAGLIFSASAVDWAQVKQNGNWSDVEQSVIPFEEAGIDDFQQSPVLDSQVEKGELPEVSERLPEQPLVVKPSNEIGKYGGTFTLGGPRPHLASIHHSLMETPLHLNRYNPTTEFFPNIIKDWEYDNDGKVLTLHLRKGLKWSDGHPFTAEDFEFYYQDVAFNEDLTPVTAATLRPVEEVEAVDDYTFRYYFDKPYFAFAKGNLCAFAGQQGNSFLPKHYMKQFHIDYNEDADQMAEEEGYDRWVELFGHYNQQGSMTPEDVPTLAPWIKDQDTGDAIIFKRNPYFWKVDPEGRQLPYFDRVIVRPWKNTETFVTQIISGDLDWAGWSVPITEYPTIKESESQGNYRAWIGKNPKGNDSAIFFNQNAPDEAVREIFQNKKFRQAMSLSLNREEISEVVFLGQAQPRAAAFNRQTPGVTDEWNKAFIEYDPEKAQQMLNEIGLKDEDGDGWRENFDGESFTPTLLVTQDYPFNINTAELVRDYWKDIGINANVKVISRSLFNERSSAGNYEVTFWMIDSVGPNKVSINRGAWFTWQGWALAGPDYAQWLNTEGEEGVEPPQEIKDVYEKGDKLPFVNEETQAQLISEIGSINAEQQWIVGTVYDKGSVTVANNDVGNVRSGMGTWTGDGVSSGGTGSLNWMDQYYWKNAEKREN